MLEVAKLLQGHDRELMLEAVRRNRSSPPEAPKHRSPFGGVGGSEDVDQGRASVGVSPGEDRHPTPIRWGGWFPTGGAPRLLPLPGIGHSRKVSEPECRIVGADVVVSNLKENMFQHAAPEHGGGAHDLFLLLVEVVHAASKQPHCVAARFVGPCGLADDADAGEDCMIVLADGKQKFTPRGDA